MVVHNPRSIRDAETAAVEVEEDREEASANADIGFFREVEAEGGVAGYVADGDAVPRGIVGRDGLQEGKGFRWASPRSVDGAVVEDTEPAGDLVDDLLGVGSDVTISHGWF